MPIVRNKTEKIKIASNLEAVMEHFEVVTFKAASHLDLASLRDHKNMLLSEFINGKGVFCDRFGQIFVSLQTCVFLNFAKGMICNYYKCFVVVL